MKRAQKILALVLALLLLAGVLSGCSGKAALKGRWACTGGTAPWGMPDEVEFFSDGTCDVDGLNGTYAVDGGRLRISAFLSTFTYDYKVSGGKLTLDDGGVTAVYEKN